MSTEDLRWISWKQHGDAEHDPDCRPVVWPPPEEVLAFWKTGLGGEGGVNAYCTVVALVRASSAREATTIIKKAWSPGFGEERFNREYGGDEPPGDRFPPPAWSIKLGRWPWDAGPGTYRRATGLADDRIAAPATAEVTVLVEQLRHACSVAFSDLLAQGMPPGVSTGRLLKAAIVAAELHLWQTGNVYESARPSRHPR